jgi:capsular exopolysaccharide synthesis family protein
VDLKDVLRALRRSWWLVLAAAVTAVGIACGLTATAAPQYATSVTFFVSTPSDGVSAAYQGGLFSQQRVKSYAELLRGERLARAVAEDGSLGLTPGQIQARTSARAVPETVLLQATVTDPDPARSEKVAKALAERFMALVETLETPPGGRTPTVKVEVVAGPLLDSVPVSPRPARNLALATLLGLLIGAAAAVLRETLDTTVKSAEALSALTTAPALAAIPFDATAKRKPLVMGGNAHSARAESFRQLRTNLQFVDVDRPVKAIAVTSAVPEEGKSTTAVNLAIAFAEAGSRVLLVEADLRRPRIAEYLGLEGAVGLSNVLAGQVRVDEVLQQWGSHELHVLPSGFIPPNPSELLGSAAMAALLDHQRQSFDMVIIDTPPLLPVTDGAVVAVQADGALLVTRSGKTARVQVTRATAALSAVDARILGCVLNMQPGKTDTPYYYGKAQTRRGVSAHRRGEAAPVPATPAPARGTAAAVDPASGPPPTHWPMPVSGSGRPGDHGPVCAEADDTVNVVR